MQCRNSSFFLPHSSVTPAVKFPIERLTLRGVRRPSFTLPKEAISLILTAVMVLH